MARMDGGEVPGGGLMSVVTGFVRETRSDDNEVSWGGLVNRFNGLMEQKREFSERERVEIRGWIEVCSAQQAVTDMMVIDAMRHMARLKTILMELRNRRNQTDGDGRKDSWESVSRLEGLLEVTRERASLYFMPALVPNAVGFCGRPVCANCSAAFVNARSVGDSSRSSMQPRNFSSLVPGKELLDEFVSRCGLVAIILVLRRESVSTSRRGFKAPPSLFNEAPEATGKSTDGLCLWPALVVRPSSAADRIRQIWPTLVAGVHLAEKQSMLSKGPYKTHDARLGFTIHITKLEKARYTITLQAINMVRKDGEEQIPSFLEKLRTIATAADEVMKILEPNSQRGWFSLFSCRCTFQFPEKLVCSCHKGLHFRIVSIRLLHHYLQLLIHKWLVLAYFGCHEPEQTRGQGRLWPRHCDHHRSEYKIVAGHPKHWDCQKKFDRKQHSQYSPELQPSRSCLSVVRSNRLKRHIRGECIACWHPANGRQTKCDENTVKKRGSECMGMKSKYRKLFKHFSSIYLCKSPHQ